MDILTDVVKLLWKNKRLLELLHYKGGKEKRIYQRKAPYQEETPRLIALEISCAPVEWYDNQPSVVEFFGQLSLLTEKASEITPVVDEVVATLSAAGFIVQVGTDIWQEDTGLFHKPISLYKKERVR